MKSISGLMITQLDNTTSPPNNTKYCINHLLYNEPKINIWNISADINDANYEKFVVSLVKIANT